MRLFNKNALKPTIAGIVYTWEDSQGYVHKAIQCGRQRYQFILTEGTTHDTKALKQAISYSQGEHYCPTQGDLINQFKEYEKTGP